MLTVRIPGGPDLLWRTSPLSHEPIPCQSEHDDYVYSRGGVIMSDRHILVLECLLSDERLRLWLCLILSSIKWSRYPMTPVLNYSECIDWYIQGPGRTWTLMVVLSYLALNSLVIGGTGTKKPLGVTSSSLTTCRHEPDDGFAQLF
jgi:hypothetical protein